MSRYHRNHPDEPTHPDFFAGAKVKSSADVFKELGHDPKLKEFADLRKHVESPIENPLPSDAN